MLLLPSYLSIRLACETRVSRYEQSRNGAHPDWDSNETELVSSRLVALLMNWKDVQKILVLTRITEERKK